MTVRRPDGIALAYAGREVADVVVAMKNAMVPPPPQPVHLLAVPSNAGCRGALGLRLGPDQLLREITRSDHIARRNVVRLPGALVDTARIATITRRVAATVARTVATGRLPLVLGGDHTVALGSILGVRDGLRRRSQQPRRPVPLFVLWLDAHPDANTRETSPSGNLHGMVLSGLLGHGPLAVEAPFQPERIVVAGARTFDPGERAFLRAHPQIALWDVSALRGDAWRPLAEQFLHRVRRARGRLYVSLDLDVLDPQHAPGVAIPVPGGAFPEPLLSLLRYLAASGLLAGADVVELDPSADPEGRTVRLAAQAVEALAARTPAASAHATPAPRPVPAESAAA